MVRRHVVGRTYKDVQVVVSYAEAIKVSVCDVRFVGYMYNDTYYDVGGKLCIEEVHGNNGLYKNDDTFSNRFFVFNY